MARTILRAGRIAAGGIIAVIVVTAIFVCAARVLTLAQTISVPVVVSPEEQTLLSVIAEQPGTDEALAAQKKLVSLYVAEEQWSMPRRG